MKKATIIQLILILLFPVVLSAGSSIFGFGPNLVGTFQYPSSATSLGRGGVSMAYFDSVSLNHSNFASWAYIPRSSLTLNLRYEGTITTSEFDESSSFNTNFFGGFLALPLIKNKFVMGIGLRPQSINDFSVKNKDVGVGTSAIQTIQSTGNLSEAQIVAAFAIRKNLSIALIGNFTFGMITDRNTIVYNALGYGNIDIENRHQIHGIGLEVNSFYLLNNDFAAGLAFKFPTGLTLYSDQESISSEKTVVKFKDLTLPLSLSTGISYMISRRLKGGVDYNFRNWKKGYKVENAAVAGMANSYRFGFGLERLPLNRRFISYTQSMTYRTGFFYGKMNREINGHDLDEYGLSVGVGLPITRTRNRIDISFEYGKRGNLELNLLSETFVRMQISLATNELWFVREER